MGFIPTVIPAASIDSFTAKTKPAARLKGRLDFTGEVGGPGTALWFPARASLRRGLPTCSRNWNRIP